MQQYDLIVIGSGPAGYRAAAYAAGAGKSVAIIESRELGGTCLNRGCVPTKCLCAAAERLSALKTSDVFGITAEAVHADYSAAVQRAGEIVDTLRGDVGNVLKGVDIYRGKAVIAEGRTVVTGTDFLKGHRIIIATGSQPSELRTEGSCYTMDSDAFLRLERLPQRMCVIGGGVIGLEFASIAAAYGTEVTVLEYCSEVLPGCDPQIAKRLRTALSRRGIKFHTGAKVTGVSADHTVTFECKGKQQTVACDAVLSAVGRRATLPEGLAAAGIKVNEKGFIEVNDNFETTAEGVYAIGDVNGRCMLAHAAYGQARIVTGLAEATGVIPSVVFTTPECAWAGANADSDTTLRSVTVPYGGNAKALAADETGGMLKLVYRADGTIAGVQAVGAHAADLVAAGAIAIDAGYDVRKLAYYSVSAHPGLSELLESAATAAARELQASSGKADAIAS